MDIHIPTMYKDYGEYVNHFRQFPLDLDGLRPVERRVLLSAYEVARDKMVKCAKVDGSTIANYHPHGSCYSTIVQLANRGLLDKQGNFGRNIGADPDPPAAMRYTECKLAKITKDIAFKLIDSVDRVQSELDDEPPFLPTMYPICLLGNEFTIGIGFGYRTMIPCYKLEDLRSRLMFLLGKGPKVIIKPVTDCDIISDDSDLEQLLTTGKASIKVRGKFVENRMYHKVSIKSWPPGKGFEAAILSKLQKELDSQDIGWMDCSETQTDILFEVMKQRNKDEIYKNLVSRLPSILSGSIHFESIVVDQNRKVFLKSVDSMLLTTYNMFKSVNEKMLADSLAKTELKIDEMNLLAKIKVHLPKYLKKTEIDIDETVKQLSEDCKEKEEKIKEQIRKHSIQKLLTLEVDTTGLQKIKDELRNFLSNTEQYTIKQY